MALAYGSRSSFAPLKRWPWRVRTGRRRGSRRVARAGGPGRKMCQIWLVCSRIRMRTRLVLGLHAVEQAQLHGGGVGAEEREVDAVVHPGRAEGIGIAEPGFQGIHSGWERWLEIVTARIIAPVLQYRRPTKNGRVFSQRKDPARRPDAGVQSVPDANSLWTRPGDPLRCTPPSRTREQRFATIFRWIPRGGRRRERRPSVARRVRRRPRRWHRP